MFQEKKMYYEKRAQVLLKNLRGRRFEAYYCDNKEDALKKALELIPKGASISWGGAASAREIGLMDAVKHGEYRVLDRDTVETPEEKARLMKQAQLCDVFLCGANALSLDGQMVNIDGVGNRVAAIAYGPETVLVIAGMNKVMDTLEDAVRRARTVAAPINKQRFPTQTPCHVTGSCANCHGDDCICNEVLITRGTRVPGRIKFILVGEDLGF